MTEAPTTAPIAPAAPEGAGSAPVEAVEAVDQVLPIAAGLVEDVSIDGMCGVY